MFVRLRFPSIVVAVVTGAMVVSLAPILAAEASPIAAAAPAKVDSRPDRVSAMVAARVQKSRVEDESARTPTTTTYANPDGTWTVESYSGVVRSKVDAERWVPVDPSVEKTGKVFEPKAAPFDARFSDGGDRALGSLRTGTDSQVKVGWPTKLPAPTVNGTDLTYPDAAPGADLIVGSAANGFSYSMVLDHAPAADAPPVEYRIPLTFDGVSAKVFDDGSIELKDGKTRVATMTAPIMWDEANKAEDGDRHPVATTVEGTGDSRTLVLRPDMDFLRDPDTTYPVTVDPTVTLNVAYDTWVDSLSPTASQISAPDLRVGSTSLGITKDRSYLYFDFTQLSSMPEFVVTAAQLQVSDYATGSCTGSAVRMSQVTSAYNIATMSWSTQPTTTATGSATSTAAFGASGCAGEGLMTFDATAVVNSWAGGASNWGVQLKADNESAASGARTLRSADYGDPAKAPKLVLTYNSYPSRPTGTSISPGNTYGATAYASSLTPTLSTVISDPDGGTLRGYFEIYNASNTLIWSGTSAWATSGDRVSKAVPTGILANGSTYTVAAYSQDATLKSKSAMLRQFTVDTSAPATTITNTAYTNNSWTTTAPSSNNFTLTGPSDTASFDTVIDGIPRSVPANASGAFSFPWYPVAAWHTLTVNAIDRAGNRGATASFNYGSGAPGFTTPQENQPSTAVFPLDISAPPNSTGATLTWKLNNETTWRAMGTGTVTKAGTAWTSAVTTSSGRTITGQLLWNATAEQIGGVAITAPRVLNLQACFHYAAAADKCTYSRTLELVPSAFGDNYPTAQVGPATVALYTGEASIGGVDAADSTAGLGRTFSSFDASTLGAGLFGPGWSNPSVLGNDPAAKTQVIDNRSKDGNFVIVEPSSDAQTFVPVSAGSNSFVPLKPTGDATSLTFTPGTTPTLVLVRPVGKDSVKTTWTLVPAGAEGPATWVYQFTDAPGTHSDGSADNNNHPYPVWIRESDPAAAATCSASTQTLGCRGLKITYTGSGASTRVATVKSVIGADQPASPTERVIATYNYTAGSLTSVCSASPGGTSPALCTSYTYTTVAGRTLLAQAKPAGLTEWRFTYDASARLINVKRTKPTGGDATWSVDYGLATTAAGLPDLSATTAAQWGQQSIPTKVYAVYQPYLGTADVTKAALYYSTTDGTLTNTATYGPSGWLVDTSWLNANGDEVQHLDSTGWARVQAAPVADRPRIAAEASSYTVYNQWGDADTVGTRVTDKYGPAHTATLKSGTVGTYRTHTATMYDDDPNVDTALITSGHGSTGLGLVVQETSSASDPARTADYDSVVTKYGYEPVVTGDGNGWDLGMPTTVSTHVSGSTWSTSTTRYDDSGREIESRQPGGAEDASHVGTDAHSTVTTYYTLAGSGNCSGNRAWVGLVCTVGPPAGLAGTYPTTFNANFNADLQPTEVRESVGNDLRKTTTDYDALGRVTGITKATTGSGLANETIATTYGYDGATGLATTTTAGGSTITAGYDAWGRPSTYVDSLGTSSTQTYDGAGNTATFNDGAATYAYAYDTHGILSSVDAGGGVGTFTYSFASTGDLDSVTYPNGVVAKNTYDEIGGRTGLAYNQAATQLLAFTQAGRADGQVVAASSPMSSQQFGYDDLGRLTNVQDTQVGGCTTRIYDFDGSSNRIGFSSYAPAGSTLACQSANAAVIKSNSYDSAGRITSAGYAYDTLGRTLTTPQVDAGPGAAGNLAASYHADDMVASLSQNVLKPTGGSDAKVMTYGLDPAERIRSITTTTNGTETQRLRYRFTGPSDTPSLVDQSTDSGTTWSSTRYVNLPGIGMPAVSSGGVVTAQLANLHGDLVATMPNTASSTSISSYSEFDEFGNVLAPGSTRYGWLGTNQRSADALGGVVLMGARVYNPSTGLFTAIDSVRGGNATSYTYPQDPIGQRDLSGRFKVEGQFYMGEYRESSTFYVSLNNFQDMWGSAAIGINMWFDDTLWFGETVEQGYWYKEVVRIYIQYGTQDGKSAQRTKYVHYIKRKPTREVKVYGVFRFIFGKYARNDYPFWLKTYNYTSYGRVNPL